MVFPGTLRDVLSPDCSRRALQPNEEGVQLVCVLHPFFLMGKVSVTLTFPIRYVGKID